MMIARPNASVFAGAGFIQLNQNVHNALTQQLNSLNNLFTSSSFQSITPQNLGLLPGATGGYGLAGGFVAAGYVPAPQTQQCYPTNPSSGKSGLIQTSKNPPEYVTPGGYKVAAEGKDNAWTITTPEGKTTRIWGDPHVKESDGGKWDFKKDMSFVLPDGTKISCKTTPPRSNGYTVTESIDIMHGNERATIGGIDKNKPVSEGVQGDRWAVDARHADGDYAVLGGNGDDWFLHGKNEIVGSSKQGEILHTKQGPATGVTGLAQRAMQEPTLQQPRYGGQNFLQLMLQQLLQQLLGATGLGF